jgi:Clostripain family
MKDWTIMVYMAGDNDLNTEMAYTLQKLKEITQDNSSIDLFVYFDGFSSNVPTLYCDFSDHKSTTVNYYRSYNVKDKLIKREKRLKNDFNENSASMNNIINFVDWCVKKDKYISDEGVFVDKRKDKKYAMIFSGHSFGFLDWGLFKDEKADFHMTLSKLKWLFERITFDHAKLKKIAEADQKTEQKVAEKTDRDAEPWSDEKLIERTTEILGKPFDLLGFDSCVMSTLEIGSQFKGLAQTMVASEGSIPSAGWNYAQILLGKLNDKGNSDAEVNSIAVSFVDEFIKQQNKFALADISVDMAAWNLNALPELEKSFLELVINLTACFKDKKSVSYHQMKRVLIQSHWQCQTYLFEQHVDLGDFCIQLSKEIGLLKNEVDNKHLVSIIKVGKSCAKVIKSIRKCILLSGFSGSDFQFSNGISLFFPWSLESYICAKKDYEKLSFIKDNEAGKKWNKFLAEYLTKVTLRGSKPLTKIKDGHLIIAPDADSVVYESYTFLDKNSNIEYLGNASTDEHKQAPNGPKQAPNGPRLFDNVGIFLSRFMKLKNFECNWNRAGFICNSDEVRFTQETENSTSQRQTSARTESDQIGKIPVVIPGNTAVNVVIPIQPQHFE